MMEGSHLTRSCEVVVLPIAITLASGWIRRVAEKGASGEGVWRSYVSSDVGEALRDGSDEWD